MWQAFVVRIEGFNLSGADSFGFVTAGAPCPNASALHPHDLVYIPQNWFVRHNYFFHNVSLAAGQHAVCYSSAPDGVWVVLGTLEVSPPTSYLWLIPVILGLLLLCLMVVAFMFIFCQKRRARVVAFDDPTSVPAGIEHPLCRQEGGGSLPGCSTR